MTFTNQQATATPEQQSAAISTIDIEEQISKFISESKRVTIINLVLTGIIVILTIINVVIAIAE